MNRTSAAARRRTTLIRTVCVIAVGALLGGAVLAGASALGTLAPEAADVTSAQGEAVLFAKLTATWDAAERTVDDACTVSLTGGTLTSAADEYALLAGVYADTLAALDTEGAAGTARYPAALPALPADAEFCAFATELGAALQ